LSATAELLVLNVLNHNVFFFPFMGIHNAAIQLGLSSSNVLCFIAIVAIVSFEQINHCHCHSHTRYRALGPELIPVIPQVN